MGAIRYPRVHPGEVQLYRVPAETVYVADGFEIAALPTDTAAVSLRLMRDFPEVEPFDGSLTGTRRNPDHVRSFELTHYGEPLVDGVTTTLKGGEWTDPALRWENEITIENTLYHGGVQLEDALATLSVSHKMDELGIRGERIQRIDAPQVLVVDYEPKSAKKVIGGMVRNLRPEYTGDRSYIFCDSNGLLGRFKLWRHLAAPDRRPVTMIRTASTDLRLSDVCTDYSAIDREEIVQSGMDALGQVDPDYTGLEVASAVDITTYFEEALPYNYGTQLGMLGAHSHWQLFPHPGNILLDGGLVDLDGIVPQVPRWSFAEKFLLHGCKDALVALGVNYDEFDTDYDRISRNFRGGVAQGRRTVNQGLDPNQISIGGVYTD